MDKRVVERRDESAVDKTVSLIIQMFQMFSFYETVFAPITMALLLWLFLGLNVTFGVQAWILWLANNTRLYLTTLVVLI